MKTTAKMPERFNIDAETGMAPHVTGEFVLYSDYAALEARLKECERDSERYRWLRAGIDRVAVYCVGSADLKMCDEELDSFVDAALNEQEQKT